MVGKKRYIFKYVQNGIAFFGTLWHKKQVKTINIFSYADYYADSCSSDP